MASRRACACLLGCPAGRSHGLHRRFPGSAALLLGGFASACGAEADPPALLAAEPFQVTASAGFDLVLTGRGFGLDGVTVDLERGSGASSGSSFTVVLLGPDDFEATVAPPDLTVSSPRRLALTVRLEQPPPPGRFGARLMEDDEVLAERDDLFEVVGGE